MFGNRQARDTIENVRSMAGSTAKDLRDRAGNLADDVRDRLPEANNAIARAASCAQSFVSVRPVASMAAVGLVGLLIGLSLRSRS